MALTFRIAHTPICNTIFSGKPLSEVDVSLFRYGEPMENKIFKIKDENGDTTLLQAWRRKCLELNKRHPNIHYWVDTEQPDRHGAYYGSLWDTAIETLANVESITPQAIETAQRLFVDAITSDDPAIRGRGIAMMQTALGFAAERIVVLESLLESERKLRQEDRYFALKNATHL